MGCESLTISFLNDKLSSILNYHRHYSAYLSMYDFVYLLFFINVDILYRILEEKATL